MSYSNNDFIFSANMGRWIKMSKVLFKYSISETTVLTIDYPTPSTLKLYNSCVKLLSCPCQDVRCQNVLLMNCSYWFPGVFLLINTQFRIKIQPLAILQKEIRLFYKTANNEQISMWGKRISLGHDNNDHVCKKRDLSIVSKEKEPWPSYPPVEVPGWLECVQGLARGGEIWPPPVPSYPPPAVRHTNLLDNFGLKNEAL